MPHSVMLAALVTLLLRFCSLQAGPVKRRQALQAGFRH